MTNKILNREGECKGGEKTRKKIILAIVAIALCATMIVFTVQPSIASWIDTSVVSVVTSTANSSFTTQVVGVYTNATLNPIGISGGGGTTYTDANIASYNTGPIPGNPSSPSVAAIVASGWVPNDMVEFQVTIKNTGTVTLQFNPYTVNCYFVTEPGNVPINTVGPFYNENGYSTGDTNLVVPWTWLGFVGAAGGGITDSVTFTNSVDSTNRQVFADNLIDGMAGSVPPTPFPWGTFAGQGNNINWEVGWGIVGGTSGTFPTTLAPTATFVYNLYIGLGCNAPSIIPNMYFSLSIPMTVAN